MTLESKILSLTDGKPINRKTAKLIIWLQKKKFLKKNIRCRLCQNAMKLKKKHNSTDVYRWYVLSILSSLHFEHQKKLFFLSFCLYVQYFALSYILFFLTLYISLFFSTQILCTVDKLSIYYHCFACFFKCIYSVVVLLY